MNEIAPPYPKDTRAKGWRFELDYEKIDQSDTWSLAADVPLARSCLLAVWLAAWTQEPCGSLPKDEAVIRARCQIPAAIWAKVRHIVMRGWWLANDGRLYHDTLTLRVQEMIEYRKKNAKRVADFKAAKREQHVGNALPLREHIDKNDTGTGTGTIEEQKLLAVAKPKRGSKRCPDGFEPTVEQFQAMQAECPGLNLASETRNFRDWEFKDAKTDWAAAWRRWMRKAFKELTPSETNYQRSMRERAEEATPSIAATRRTATAPNPMEVLDGLTRIAG